MNAAGGGGEGGGPSHRNIGFLRRSGKVKKRDDSSDSDEKHLTAESSGSESSSSPRRRMRRNDETAPLISRRTKRRVMGTGIFDDPHFVPLLKGEMRPSVHEPTRMHPRVPPPATAVVPTNAAAPATDIFGSLQRGLSAMRKSLDLPRRRTFTNPTLPTTTPANANASTSSANYPSRPSIGIAPPSSESTVGGGGGGGGVSGGGSGSGMKSQMRSRMSMDLNPAWRPKDLTRLNQRAGDAALFMNAVSSSLGQTQTVLCLDSETSLVIPFQWGDGSDSMDFEPKRLEEELLRRAVPGSRYGLSRNVLKVWEKFDHLPIEVSELSGQMRRVFGWSDEFLRALDEPAWETRHLRVTKDVLETLFDSPGLWAYHHEAGPILFPMIVKAISLHIYPVGVGVLVYRIDWRMEDNPLTYEELRTRLFLTRFLYKMEGVFLGWSISSKWTDFLAYDQMRGDDNDSDNSSESLYEDIEEVTFSSSDEIENEQSDDEDEDVKYLKTWAKRNAQIQRQFQDRVDRFDREVDVQNPHSNNPSDHTSDLDPIDEDNAPAGQLNPAEIATASRSRTVSENASKSKSTSPELQFPAAGEYSSITFDRETTPGTSASQMTDEAGSKMKKRVSIAAASHPFHPGDSSVSSESSPRLRGRTMKTRRSRRAIDSSPLSTDANSPGDPLASSSKQKVALKKKRKSTKMPSHATVSSSHNVRNAGPSSGSQQKKKKKGMVKKKNSNSDNSKSLLGKSDDNDASHGLADDIGGHGGGVNSPSAHSEEDGYEKNGEGKKGRKKIKKSGDPVRERSKISEISSDSDVEPQSYTDSSVPPIQAQKVTPASTLGLSPRAEAHLREIVTLPDGDDTSGSSWSETTDTSSVSENMDDFFQRALREAEALHGTKPDDDGHSRRSFGTDTRRSEASGTRPSVQLPRQRTFQRIRRILMSLIKDPAPPRTAAKTKGALKKKPATKSVSVRRWRAHVSALGKLACAAFAGKLLSLCTISNWLVHKPSGESAWNPPLRVGQSSTAFLHTSLCIDRAPTEDELGEFLVHLRRGLGQKMRANALSESISKAEQAAANPATLGRGGEVSFGTLLAREVELTEGVFRDRVIRLRPNRYIGLSESGTVSISWPTPRSGVEGDYDPWSERFERVRWPQRYHGVYALLTMHIHSEIHVLSQLSRSAVSAMEQFQLNGEMKLEFLEVLRNRMRGVVSQMVTYSFTMSSNDCGGGRDFSTYFEMLRFVMGVSTFQDSVRKKLRDIMSIVESSYLEESRRKNERLIVENDLREKIRRARQKKSETQRNRFDLCISLSGAVALPIVIVAGVWGMNLEDLPTTNNFWAIILGACLVSMLLFICFLAFRYLSGIYDNSIYRYRVGKYETDARKQLRDLERHHRLGLDSSTPVDRSSSLREFHRVSRRSEQSQLHSEIRRALRKERQRESGRLRSSSTSSSTSSSIQAYDEDA